MVKIPTVNQYIESQLKLVQEPIDSINTLTQ